MATITLNPAVYTEAQYYANEDNMSVEEWVAMLIKKFVSVKKKRYKMKKIEELSPELQAIIGFAKPNDTADFDDINGDKAPFPTRRKNTRTFTR